MSDCRIAELEAENYRLAERVRTLEEVLGARRSVPAAFGLTFTEAKVFGVLLEREQVSRQQMLGILYGQRPGADEPDMHVIDVFIFKVRKKVAPFGVAIGTVWGFGYRMSKENKAAVAEYLAAEVENG